MIPYEKLDEELIDKSFSELKSKNLDKSRFSKSLKISFQNS